MTHSHQRAFTLVEMAVVLAIIGLIVGGIMGGQSLLRNSQMQGVVSEFIRYRNAGNQFFEQYQAWPGDFPRATSVWGAVGGGGAGSACWNVANTTNATCDGNGNGEIHDVPSGVAPWEFGEAFHFWKQLRAAGLIEGQFTGKSDSTTSSTAWNPGLNIPVSSLPTGGYIVSGWNSYSSYVFKRDANDYEWQGNNLRLGTPGGGWQHNTTVIAKYVDDKMDDGLPGTGFVRGWTACGPTGSVQADKYTATYDVTRAGKICIFTVYFKDPINQL